MPLFSSNKISLGSASVAEQLKVTRAKLGLSLDQVASRIKVNRKYLEALENGDYYKVPDGIYTLNFLKEYAQCLGLDHKKIISGFQSEKRVFRSGEGEALFSRQVVGKEKMVVVPNLMKNILWSVLLLGCLLYLIILLNNIFKAPVLKVLMPIDNLVTNESMLRVSGYTEAEAELSINDRQVIVSPQGEFNLSLELAPGINTIVVVAKRGNKKPSRVVREVLLKTDANIEK